MFFKLADKALVKAGIARAARLGSTDSESNNLSLSKGLLREVVELRNVSCEWTGK